MNSAEETQLVGKIVDKIDNMVESRSEFLVDESEDYVQGYKRATFDALLCIVDSLPGDAKELLKQSMEERGE